MNLSTESHWEGWDRIVDIYTERDDKIPEYINDPDRYKILILEKGILRIKSADKEFDIIAPAGMVLSQKDKVDIKVMQPSKMEILFFHPSVIREEFTFARIDSGEFWDYRGQAIFQDYILITPFTETDDVSIKQASLSMNELMKIKDLFTSTECELKVQADGFWPCRSRSYLMELLFFIVYSFVHTSPNDDSGIEDPDKATFNMISKFLNEHISEQITLDTLTKEFAINRNKLNDIFMENSSMTCLAYLLKLRIDLAKIFLTKTEIPIGEVGARVGYHDSNYFTKVFKKSVGMSPKQFRYSRSN